MDVGNQLARMMKAAKNVCLQTHLHGSHSASVAVAINEMAAVHDSIIDEQEKERQWQQRQWQRRTEKFE
jgi:hypothetical protein